MEQSETSLEPSEENVTSPEPIDAILIPEPAGANETCTLPAYTGHCRYYLGLIPL